MTTLHVVDTGNPAGPPIVWLGSVGSALAMWDRQIPEFADRYRCVLIDHPGHGASPPATGPLSIESLADDVLATLDSKGVARAHFVGLSLGAMIAMSIATIHPDRVDRLALLCTTAHFDDQSAWAARAATVRTGGMTTLADAVVTRWLTPAYAQAHPDEVAAFVAMINATDPESYARCCEAIGLMDQRPTLRTIQAPTLVVAGTEDPATPPVHAETIANLIPNAKLATVAAAHLANWEQPNAINELLRKHLEGSGDE